MSNGHVFDTTTPRSSHVGLEGYGFTSDWLHFLDKYRQPCLTIFGSILPYHKDKAEDAFSMVYEKILTNPNILQRKSEGSFRSVLCTLMRDAGVVLIRKERAQQAERYENLMTPLMPEATSQEDERMSARLRAISLIRSDMMRPDYENGRFSREYDSLELEIWTAMQADGATFEGVKRQLGIKMPNNKIREIVERIDARIVHEAETLLASLGLI